MQILNPTSDLNQNHWGWDQQSVFNKLPTKFENYSIKSGEDSTVKLQIHLFQKKSVNIDKVNILKYSEIYV